jgi:hypothetical protein
MKTTILKSKKVVTYTDDPIEINLPCYLKIEGTDIDRYFRIDNTLTATIITIDYAGPKTGISFGCPLTTFPENMEEITKQEYMNQIDNVVSAIETLTIKMEGEK